MRSYNRRNLPEGCEPGDPRGCDFCASPDFAVAINGVRLCRTHKKRVDAISRDAKRDATSLRRPECLPFVFRAGVAT